MPQVQFFLPNPNDHANHFDNDIDLYTTTAATVNVTRYESDADHPSCMKVSTVTKGEGVYVDVSNMIPDSVHKVEFNYKCVGSQSILTQIMDQTNNSTIYAASVAATNWSSFYREVTAPITCSTIRVNLLRNDVTSGQAFYIDDVYIHGNALLADPDDYSRDYPDTHHDHRQIDGSVTRDRTGRHVVFSMRFPQMSNAAFQRLANFSRSDDPTYFNDGNVPAMTQSATLRTEASCNFVGVTVGATAGHRAYYSATSAQPVTAAFAQASGFVTANYEAVDGDDNNYVTNVVATNGNYGYHKFKFKVTNYTASDQVRKFSCKWKGQAEDLSNSNVDGVNLYAFDGYNWVLLDRSRTSATTALSFSTTKQAIAQQFVDTASNWVQLLVQTRNTRQTSAANLTLKSHYVQAVVNEDLSRVIALKNRAALSATGAVLEVKNLTDNNVLTLNQATNGYTIRDDRRNVAVTSDQGEGEQIQVKYNQYYHVIPERLSEPRVFPGDISQPYRDVALTLRTVTPIEPN